MASRAIVLTRRLGPSLGLLGQCPRSQDHRVSALAERADYIHELGRVAKRRRGLQRDVADIKQSDAVSESVAVAVYRRDKPVARSKDLFGPVHVEIPRVLHKSVKLLLQLLTVFPSMIEFLGTVI